ncbi:MAG: hypothetical protein Q7K40_02700 [bacterium]|nr:hypothetical protein [bacterium]
MIKIHGLEDYELKEIQNIVLSHIRYLRENYCLEGLDFLTIDIIPIGSRVSGLADIDSDFDIKIKYIGCAREDDMFNSLNDENDRLIIEDIIVDFFPEKG